MKLNDVKFYKSVGLNSEEVYFDDKKEIVFVGRSNMGKSSLMNALFQKKDLVKTSSKPGKTRMANLFLVENKYYFTDLPGYGFALLGKELKENLDGLISWYLEERRNSIKTVVMLVDSKLGPQKTDLEMYEYILELELPLIVVLSKIDKLGKNEFIKAKKFTEEQFFGVQVFGVSAKNKTGILDLEKILKNSLKNN